MFKSIFGKNVPKLLKNLAVTLRFLSPAWNILHNASAFKIGEVLEENDPDTKTKLKQGGDFLWWQEMIKTVKLFKTMNESICKLW